MKKLKKYFIFNKRTFFSYFTLGILALITEPFVEGYVIISALPNPIKSFLLIITDPLFFLALIFLIDVGKKNFARSVSFVTGGISVLLCMIILFVSMFGVPERFLRKQFDSVAWKEQRSVGAPKPVRIRMVDDLLKEHKLEGMSKKQLDQLLGTPNDNHLYPEYDYVYWLGFQKSLLEDQSIWLAIKFKDDVVVKTEILRSDGF